VLGFVFYPILLLVPGVGASGSAWPPAVMAVEVFFAGLLLLYVRRVIGRTGNESALILLALGALLPIAAIGLISQIFLPVEIVPDILFGLFFYTLWTHYRPPPSGPPVGAS